MRLPNYDYRQNGAYFVTCVCDHRQLLLEDVRFAGIVEHSWRWLGEQYAYVYPDEFVVMPNHVHGILMLDEPRSAASGSGPSLQARKSLGRLLGAFKTRTAREINLLRGTPNEPFWQRNFYERVIRGERELLRTREYIRDNPRRWMEDPENPSNALV